MKMKHRTSKGTKIRTYFTLLFLLTVFFLFLNSDFTVEAAVSINRISFYVDSPLVIIDKDDERMVDPDNHLITPIQREGIVLLPLDFLAEILDGSAHWNSGSLKGNLFVDEFEIQYDAHSSKAVVKDKQGTRTVDISTKTIILQEKYYVPVDSTAEILGIELFYQDGLCILSNDPKIYNRTYQKEEIQAEIHKLNNLPLLQNEAHLRTLAGSQPGPYTLDNPMGSTPAFLMEPDLEEKSLIQTDDQYIYRASNNRIDIIQATPPDDVRILQTIEIPVQHIEIERIYLHKDRLIVIGETPGEPIQTHLFLYNISNPTKAQLLKETMQDGQIYHIAKNDTFLHILTQISLSQMISGSEYMAPSYTENEQKRSIAYEDIRFFPENTPPVYLMITGMDVVNWEQEADVSVFYGFQGTVNLTGNKMLMAVPGRTMTLGSETVLYEYQLSRQKCVYQSRRVLSGGILNQTFMHWFEERLAVITAVSSRSGKASYNLYTFDKDGEEYGRMENIAVEGSVQTLRWLQESVLLIPERLDKTAVLNLHSLRSPGPVSPLNISDVPFVSQYDLTKLLTLSEGSGIHMAVLDITDPENPAELYTFILGEAGSQLTLQDNPLAFYCSSDRNTLILPVHLVQEPETGTVVLDGLCVLSTTDTGKFTVKGSFPIFPLEDETVPVSAEEQIVRVLHIGNYYYVFTPTLLNTISSTTFKPVSKLQFEYETV